MALISLSEAKEHLKVENSDEDALIQLYINAAIDYIGNFLNLENYPYAASLKAAALLIVGDLYENREAGVEKEIKPNPAVINLMFPYREGLGV